MATLKWARIIAYLTERGWVAEAKYVNGEAVYGDPDLIDPVTGERHRPQHASRIQAERDFEAARAQE
jgi:hypothetical protein